MISCSCITSKIKNCDCISLGAGQNHGDVRVFEIIFIVSSLNNPAHPNIIYEQQIQYFIQPKNNETNELNERRFLCNF